MKLLFTTASSHQRIPFKQNQVGWLLLAAFLTYWVYGWFNCLLLQDWIIENLLVIICLSLVFAGRKWLRLSDVSYVCIFAFVMLHLYGAFYAYTKNNLGYWLQHTFHLWRNPYDRIVHFSFGLFLAYPYRELLMNRFNVRGRASWLYPIEIAFSLGTVFEMIEWGVSACTDSVTGDTYVATQGDVWDAHKDIMMAAIGASVCMLFVSIIKKMRSTAR